MYSIMLVVNQLAMIAMASTPNTTFHLGQEYSRAAEMDSFSPGLDPLVREAEGLVPPEYHAALEVARRSPTDALIHTFPTPRERADCRAGIRFGAQIATSFLQGAAPTCARLLAPIGTEWIPPEQPNESTAFAQCFDVAWCARVTEIVYDTALACGWTAFEATLTAAQLEYNRCYLAVAGQAKLGATFIERPFHPGAFALIPRDDARWTMMLASMRSRYGHQSGIITMACEVGKTDAESGLPPQNILNRKGAAS